MIIFTDTTGQLGNQLFEFSSFISNSLRRNTSIVNLHFEKYRFYFEGSSSNRHNIRVTTNIPFLDKVLRKSFESVKEKNVLKGNGNPHDISKLDSKGKIIFKRGAWFTNYEDFYYYKEEIKAYFRPVQKHLKNIDTLINSCRSQVSVLIGIHMRGGDYKEFLNGKFYFEAGTYYSMMKQIATLFPGQKVGFLVCSNDPIDETIFSGLNVFKGTNHFIEDMYSLAECDYILGPPSTYTMWASFYGNTPLCKLRDPKNNIDLRDFEIDYGY
jgi:hypothetical protein